MGWENQVCTIPGHFELYTGTNTLLDCFGRESPVGHLLRQAGPGLCFWS
jgi:hypothetical protein